MTRNNADQMPREVAITLLTSGQKMSGSFRRTCIRATGREISPTNRAPAAPATAEQKLLKKLGKASAAQLHKWAKRFLRRGNRLQSVLEGSDDAGLKASLAAVDAVCEAIKLEVDNRARRGKLNDA